MFRLIICRHSRGIAPTMLIELKYSIGDRFAFNTLTPFRKIPSSERRSQIVMIPLENKSFFLNIERCSTVISLLFQIACWTTSSYDDTADLFSTDQASKHYLYRAWKVNRQLSSVKITFKNEFPTYLRQKATQCYLPRAFVFSICKSF